jgi:hypothetical protein
MSLVAKRKPASHVRKRQAQHHRRSKHYLKAYVPYLPMLAIVAAGGLVNEVWTIGSATAYADPLANTRLALLTRNSYTAVYAVLGLTLIAFLLFMVTHWYRFHRLLNRGEAFAIDHPWFDISLVIIIVGGVILTRT